MFTYQYQQPEEYRFSLDSIQLAKFVAEDLKNGQNLDKLRVLDLCAGCGVIGIQLSWHLKELRKIDFVEVQSIYTPYFEQNVNIVNRPELKLNWYVLNYDKLLDAQWSNRYDLIISNPPYFLSDHGMLSPSNFKNRCRFFLDSTFTNFILAMANSLSPNGKAYFLLRPLPQHGQNMLEKIQSLLSERFYSIVRISSIRGTDVIQLIKTI